VPGSSPDRLGVADAILDISAQDKQSTPPRLNGPYVRDEAEQARELTEMLSIFDAAGLRLEECGTAPGRPKGTSAWPGSSASGVKRTNLTLIRN